MSTASRLTDNRYRVDVYPTRTRSERNDSDITESAAFGKLTEAQAFAGASHLADCYQVDVRDSRTGTILWQRVDGVMTLGEWVREAAAAIAQRNERTGRRQPGVLPTLYHGTTRRQWAHNPLDATLLHLSSSLDDAKCYAYEAAACEEGEGSHDFEAVIVEFPAEAMAILIAAGLTLDPDSGWIDGLAHDAKVRGEPFTSPTWQESLRRCHGVAIAGFGEQYKAGLRIVSAHAAIEPTSLRSVDLPTGTSTAGGGANHPGRPEREGQLGAFHSPYDNRVICVDVAERDKYGSLRWVALDLDDPRRSAMLAQITHNDERATDRRLPAISLDMMENRAGVDHEGAHANTLALVRNGDGTTIGFVFGNRIGGTFEVTLARLNDGWRQRGYYSATLAQLTTQYEVISDSRLSAPAAAAYQSLGAVERFDGRFALPRHEPLGPQSPAAPRHDSKVTSSANATSMDPSL